MDVVDLVDVGDTVLVGFDLIFGRGERERYFLDRFWS